MPVSRVIFYLPVVLLCLAPVAQARRVSTLDPVKKTYEVSRKERILTATEKGIREVIAEKYKKRYEDWKTEFLSTDFGRAQWDAYEHNSQFLLTITVSGDNSRGGGTSKYKWDEAGHLIEATVTLGSNISKGYPNPVYYPVMSSLAPGNSSYLFSGSILAAAKIAHEFGHLNRMQQTNAAVYRMQSQLIPLYNSILLSNGLNTRDPRLVSLAKQMGGTPVEIWEDREYWGEVNAMLFLRDRIGKERSQCSLFNKIREFVKLYASTYEERFAEVADARAGSCNWQ